MSLDMANGLMAAPFLSTKHTTIISPTKRASRNTDSVTWTARRCHRLLRPLLSHIAALKNDHSLKFNDQHLQSSETSRANVSHSVAPSHPPSSTVNPRKPKPKHTYATKAARQARRQQSSQDKPATCRPSLNKALACNEITIPTPLVRKIRHHQFSSPDAALLPRRVPVNPLGDARSPIYLSKAARPRDLGQLVLKEDMARLRRTIWPNRCNLDEANLHDSVLRAFESLLRATSDTSDATASSSKSLLSMCLRKIPSYVSGRQEWEREEAEARGDTFNPASVSLEIYDELESFGAGRGYRHLRTVVRAHGVQVVMDAVREGILKCAFVEVLVKLCSCLQAYAEAEQILEVLTDKQYGPPDNTASTFADAPDHAPLQVLLAFGDQSKRESFVLGRISDLLSSGKLPRDWLYTELLRNELWSKAVRAISSKSACQGAVAFTTTILAMLCRTARISNTNSTSAFFDESRDKSERALVRALAPLATILVIGQESKLEAANPPAEHGILSIFKKIRYILHSSLAEVLKGARGKGLSGCRNGVFLILLTIYLTGSEVDDHEDQHPEAGRIAKELTQMWRLSRHHDITPQQYDRTVALVGSIAQGCARGSSQPAFFQLRALCQRMRGLDVPGEPFQRLEEDGGFLLAQRTHDLRDLLMAETIRAERASTTNTTTTASNDGEDADDAGADEAARDEAAAAGAVPGNIFSGYRWEEGISEWVCASPSAVGRSATPPQRPPRFGAARGPTSRGGSRGGVREAAGARAGVARRRVLRSFSKAVAGSEGGKLSLDACDIPARRRLTVASTANKSAGAACGAMRSPAVRMASTTCRSENNTPPTGVAMRTMRRRTAGDVLLLDGKDDDTWERPSKRRRTTTGCPSPDVRVSKTASSLRGVVGRRRGERASGSSSAPRTSKWMFYGDAMSEDELGM